MFDLVGERKLPSRRVAVWGALTGAFGLGLVTGKVLAGARPFDWPLEIVNLSFVLGWTIWLAIVAARHAPPASK